MKALGPVTVIAAGAVAVALTGTGYAVGTATTPKPLKACASKTNVLTLANSKGKCATGAHAVSLNVKGPKGDTGAKGATGVGTKGDTGATGPSDGYTKTTSEGTDTQLDPISHLGQPTIVTDLTDLPAGSYIVSWTVTLSSNAANETADCFLSYPDAHSTGQVTPSALLSLPAAAPTTFSGSVGLAVGDNASVVLSCGASDQHVFVPSGKPLTMTAVKVGTLHDQTP